MKMPSLAGKKLLIAAKYKFFLSTGDTPEQAMQLLLSDETRDSINLAVEAHGWPKMGKLSYRVVVNEVLEELQKGGLYFGSI